MIEPPVFLKFWTSDILVFRVVRVFWIDVFEYWLLCFDVVFDRLVIWRTSKKFIHGQRVWGLRR